MTEYRRTVTIEGETFTQLLEQVADLAKEQGWTHRDARLLKLHDSLVGLVETFDD
jgi:hypothetical protein